MLCICGGDTCGFARHGQALAQRHLGHIQLADHAAQGFIVDAVCLSLGIQRVTLHLNAVQAQLHFFHITVATLMHHFRRIALGLGGIGDARVIQQVNAVAVLLRDTPHHLLVLGHPLLVVLLQVFFGHRQADNRRLARRRARKALFLLRFGVFMRGHAAQNQGQADGTQHQREQDHASGQKDQQVTLRERGAITQRHGDRQGRSQRDRTANTSHGGGKIEQFGGSFGHLSFLVRLAQCALHANGNPQPAHEQQRERNGRHIAQQCPPFMAGVQDGSAHDGRQLQAQQQEDGPVESGFHHAPGALGLQPLRDEIGAIQISKIGSNTRSHCGQNARNANFFTHDVRGKRQQHQQQHHLGCGHIAHPAGDGVTGIAETPAHGSAHAQAAQGHPHEVLGDIAPREHASEHRRHGKLHGHQTRCIVEQRFAFQHVHGLVRHAQVARDGRYSHCIGGRDHGSQCKRHQQRHAGNHPVDEITQTNDREQHQHQCQQQDGLGQSKKFTLGDTPAVGKQQWRNEEQHEQLRVKRNVQALLGPGDQRTDGNLNQGQRDGSDIARSDTRKGTQHQHEQDGFNSMHRTFLGVHSRASVRRAQRPWVNIG